MPFSLPGMNSSSRPTYLPARPAETRHEELPIRDERPRLTIAEYKERQKEKERVEREEREEIERRIREDREERDRERQRQRDADRQREKETERKDRDREDRARERDRDDRLRERERERDRERERESRKRDLSPDSRSTTSVSRTDRIRRRYDDSSPPSEREYDNKERDRIRERRVESGRTAQENQDLVTHSIPLPQPHEWIPTSLQHSLAVVFICFFPPGAREQDVWDFIEEVAPAHAPIAVKLVMQRKPSKPGKGEDRMGYHYAFAA